MDKNDEYSSDSSEKHSIPPETYAYGLYGAIRNLSRVGDEYQTELPPLMTQSEYLDHNKSSIEEECNPRVINKFVIGLDIPVVWINQEVGNMKEDPASDVSLEIKNMKNKYVPGTPGISRRCLVPGCVLEPWLEIEKGSFLLGLYIFNKDFVRLKKFTETKQTGDILAYYYGKFSRSDEYQRWSECRKSKGRRCIMGQRMFSGLRQQELLCRLIHDVSQECQDSLLEVSRTFVDRRITLEQYVFSLKTLVGIKSLVDAVAIGSGKRDLTGNSIEPTKQNQAIHIRPELPTGKACSSLTSTEIIQFLTGDYRLSKTRSNDLFWEAVWPRLLARGWHSEQPNGYNYSANGKHSLVFLMPGVKKFSRWLVKGDAYLDSVTDVLNKVTLEPQLLELDSEETEMKQEQEDGLVEKRKSHCYLQPRAPSLGTAAMKLTVVDTSLGSGKIFTVRELEPMNMILRSHSDDFHSELVSSHKTEFIVDQDMNFNGHKPVKKQKTSKFPGKNCMKTSNGQDSSKKVKKFEQEDSGRPAKRRRRLTACGRVDSKTEKNLTDNFQSHFGSSSQANNNNKLSSNLTFSSRCNSVDTVDDLIDLNYPHVAAEFGMEMVDVKEERNEPSSQKQSENVDSVKEQDNGVSRRHSTRNRPLTAKALEAIANGFLTVGNRKKGKEDNA